MKIALLSFADIGNYGDVFFPYAFAGELKKRIPYADIDYITNLPVDIAGVQSIQYSYEILENYDAAILCGGETIHNMDEGVWDPIYYRLSKGTFLGKPSDIVFSWTNANVSFKAWFATGVPPVQPSSWAPIVNSLNSLDYISLRGVLSKKIIENDYMGNNPNIDIVPDIGWVFNEYISEPKEIRKHIAEKYDLGDAFDRPYCIVQFHDSTWPPVKEVVSTLVMHQQKTGIPIYMLPIIKPWNDSEIMGYIRDASDQKLLLLPDNLSFLEIGSILLGSVYFCGSSMHGAITTLSVGKPAGVIHPWPATKLQDLFGAAYMPKLFINDWNRLGELMIRLDTETQQLSSYFTKYSEFIRTVLSWKFDEFCIQMQRKVEMQ